MDTAVGVAYDILLTAGVVLLGAGFFWSDLPDLRGLRRRRGAGGGSPSRGRDARGHVAAAAGWIVFGVFWFLHVGEYADQQDVLNALGAAVALPVFLFIAYHEWLSYRWRETYEPLQFLTGAAFFASAVYFVFARVPSFAAVLVDAVADQTAGALTAIGYPFQAGAVGCGGLPLSACPSGEAVTVGLWRAPMDPRLDPTVNIVLACTALQAYAVAASLMLSTADPWRRKALALGIVLPVTYVMNLVRNVIVIYFFGVEGGSFDLAHNWYGKTLSLAVLLVLIFVAFRLLPELYLNMNGLFELPWRKAPGHDYRAYVGRLRKKQAEAGPTTPAAGDDARSRTGGAGRTPPSSP